MVAEGLSEIDNFASFWPEFAPYLRPLDERLFYRFHRFGAPQARIKRLEISSPPLIVLHCTPDWLGVYIAIAGLTWAGVVGIWNMVATYDQFKTGLESIRTDLQGQIEAIQGLTDKARAMVTEVVDSFIDGLLGMAAHDLESALVRVRRIQEARSRLAIPSERPHTALEVIKDQTDEEKAQP